MREMQVQRDDILILFPVAWPSEAAEMPTIPTASPRVRFRRAGGPYLLKCSFEAARARLPKRSEPGGRFALLRAPIYLLAAGSPAFHL